MLSIMPLYLFAQFQCGFEYNQNYNSSNLNNTTKCEEKTDAETSQYVIPTIVHIIHLNGPENIPDAQVHAAIKETNDHLKGLYGGYNTKIKLVLANIDPDGNCTSGIERIYSQYTDTNPPGHKWNLHTTTSWDKKKYLNIWIIKNGPLGQGGSAVLPPTTSILDGITISYWAFGSTSEFGSAPYYLKTLTHELGHYLGLYHIWGEDDDDDECNGNHCHQNGLTESECCKNGDFVCDTPPCIRPLIEYDCLEKDKNSNCENCNSNWNWLYPEENYMGYFHACATEFTEGQAKRMYYFLKTARKELWDSKFENSYAIYSTEIFHHDVEIMPGATFNVYGTCIMAPNKKIIVHKNAKLIVNGGKITSNCNKWSGIKVTGGNFDPAFNFYDVKFIDATIENTNNAAVSMFPALPWPEKTNYGNGKLDAQNTIFRNCNRLAEFIAYQPRINKSTIVNCTQYGGKWGITNWNCSDLHVIGCKFFNIQDRCIIGEDADFSLIGNNEFHGGSKDIMLTSTHAVLPSNIYDNIFYSTNRNIFSSALSIGKHNIENNKFNYSFKNIEIRGENNYTITDNKFEGYYGIFNVANGFGSNFIQNNRFSNTKYGIRLWNNNGGLIFRDNCFNTTKSDIRIHGNVNPIQIKPGMRPVNNCFTHTGNTNSSVTSISGYPNNFEYWEPDDRDTDCKDAILSTPNVTRKFSYFNDPSNPCDYIVAPPNDEFSFQKIVTAEIKAGNFTKVRKLIKSNGNNQLLIYSTYLLEGDLVEAKKYLATIENKEFVTLQKINLKRLNNKVLFTPTLAELNEIQSIALKSNENSGIALSLYYSLTKILLEPKDGDEVDDNFKFTSISKIGNPKIFPNPANNYFTIKFNDANTIEITITDSFGNKILQQKSSQNVLKINATQFKQGVYYIHIIKDKTNIYSKKILIE